VPAGSLDQPVLLPRLAPALGSAAGQAASLLRGLSPAEASAALSSWDLGCYVAARVAAPSWADAVLQRLHADVAQAEAAATAAQAASGASGGSGGSGPPKKKTKRQASAGSAAKEEDAWWLEVSSAALVAPWESYAADLLHGLDPDASSSCGNSNGSSSSGTVGASRGSGGSDRPARGVLHALHAALVRTVVSAPRNLFGAWSDAPASRVTGASWLPELLRHARALVAARDAVRSAAEAHAAADAAAAKEAAAQQTERRVAQFDQGPHAEDDDDDDSIAAGGGSSSSGGGCGEVFTSSIGGGENGGGVGVDGDGEEGNGGEGNGNDAMSEEELAAGAQQPFGDGSSVTLKGALAGPPGSGAKAAASRKASRARDEVGDEAILDGATYALLDELLRITNGAAAAAGLGGSSSSGSKVSVYGSLSLASRVAVGECVCHLALESHALRAHSFKTVATLQALSKCRSAEYGRLPTSSAASSAAASGNGSRAGKFAAAADDAAFAARHALARK
jgi:hypothetical protein